jgi:hypothetical protein
MALQALLNLLPKLAIDDGRVLAVVDDALVGDLADIGRVLN